MRCVNIDWLEVYCEESSDRYPCNADYFRRQGCFVKEREYGTRVYEEMFFIQDKDGNDIIEIRRNPKSGDSSFKGLSQFSTHIRLCNWVCYRSDCVSILREFLLRHDYIFHRIYRIDVCYDFERFDSGDKPARVARRIIEKTYLKMNQGRISVHGADNWSDYDWETLSWGSQSSMVTTKFYNKTKELKATGNKKPYILTQWMECDLLTNPCSQTKMGVDGKLYAPEIWRVEFSVRSKADSWLILDERDKRTKERKRVPHTMALFDSKDKLWQRFQDLAYHYFRFKVVTYKKVRSSVTQFALDRVKSDSEKSLQRKDRMPDKVLFRFNLGKSFMHVQAVPKPSKPDNAAVILRRRLIAFGADHFDPKVRKAVDVILECIDVRDMYRYTSDYALWQVRAMQAALQLKMSGDARSYSEIYKEVEHLIKNEEIW